MTQRGMGKNLPRQEGRSVLHLRTGPVNWTSPTAHGKHQFQARNHRTLRCLNQRDCAWKVPFQKDPGTSSRKSIEEVEWPNFSKAEMWEEDALTPHSPVKIDRSESLPRVADPQGSYS